MKKPGKTRRAPPGAGATFPVVPPVHTSADQDAHIVPPFLPSLDDGISAEEIAFVILAQNDELSGVAAVDGVEISALVAHISSNADEQFADDGDPIAALRYVSLMLLHGAAVPRSIARWLEHGITEYLDGKARTLDDALGLKAAGKASPRRQAAERMRSSNAMLMMQVLHAMGATIPQAAAMVVKFAPYEASTLESRYRRSRMSAQALMARKAPDLMPNVLRYWAALIRRWVDPLPDGTDKNDLVRMGKAAIKRMYAKHARSRT
jgi:hypothetical protein